MTMTLIADALVDVDAEGFLTDPEQWNEQIAQAIAAENGIPELTDRHWLVVSSCASATSPRAPASIRSARQGVRRPDQGALPALPQGACCSPPRSAASPSPRAASRRSTP